MDRIRHSAVTALDFDRHLIEQIFHFYSTVRKSSMVSLAKISTQSSYLLILQPSIDSNPQSVKQTIESYLSRINGEKVTAKYVAIAVEAIYNRLKMAATFEKSPKVLRNFTLFQQSFSDNFPFEVSRGIASLINPLELKSKHGQFFCTQLSITSDVMVLEEENYENFLRNSKILDTIHNQSIFGWWDYGKSY